MFRPTGNLVKLNVLVVNNGDFSGEPARHELSHLNLNCLLKPVIDFSNERVNSVTIVNNQPSLRFMVSALYAN